MSAILVPIPWQPHLWLTPHTLGYLQRASSIAGHNLHLYDREWETLSPAWRSYQQQKLAYDRWRAGQGPVASHPDHGQRSHMRGTAFDLVETTTAVQAACRKVGLIRDSTESWHWNDPAWASMPIIPTNPATAADTIALTGRTDVATLYKKNETKRWALAGDSVGTTANWIETTNFDLAKAWSKVHGHSVKLSDSLFDSIKARYLEPVKVKQ